MAIPRKDQIDSENAGYYHLTSRCVRRAFLCGEDPETKRSYEHRRAWIETRILALAKIFAIEVYAYAVMHNHYHLVVYCDPRAPQAWSDLQVAERWLQAFPGKLDKPEFAKQRELRLQAIVANPELLAEYRSRLGSLSWLMRRINEPVAKLANAEDFCKGHFYEYRPWYSPFGPSSLLLRSNWIQSNLWEARFTSQALLDEKPYMSVFAVYGSTSTRYGRSTRNWFQINGFSGALGRAKS